jgi:hypothetical protein
MAAIFGSRQWPLLEEGLKEAPPVECFYARLDISIQPALFNELVRQILNPNTRPFVVVIRILEIDWCRIRPKLFRDTISTLGV